jgi:hypothetical protein
MANPEIK